MTFARFTRLAQPKNAQSVFVLVVLLIASAAIWNLHRKPRVWLPAETPVAFWAWRNQSPSDADVRMVTEKTKAHAIFMRAGQIDLQDGKLRRIRAVTGLLPKDVDLHLVYNATRSLLAQFEQVDEDALSDAIAEAYRTDTERATHERARVVGVQIDIDVPTRLLRRYEVTLKRLRTRLKPGTKLSITGLPTWMQSPELRSTLSEVDFWIPQLYGAEIPERFDRSVPISSVQSISHFVSQARELDKPFYAGLAAYSWTLLYNSSGSRISLRGDMDPELIAADQNLELLEELPFDQPDPEVTGALISSEWRTVYRAKADGVTDQLAMHAGDLLVVDAPSAESLRVSARTVRELAGEKLLGICVFRLPANDDPATLTLSQVASALADRDSVAKVEVRLLPDLEAPPIQRGTATNWILEIKNVGTANATIGSVKLDLQLSRGTIESLTQHKSTSIEFLCAAAATSKPVDAQPCSQRRADVIRVRPRTLRSGQTVTARLSVNLSTSRVLPVFIEMQIDTGQLYQDRLEIILESESKR